MRHETIKEIPRRNINMIQNPSQFWTNPEGQHFPRILELTRTQTNREQGKAFRVVAATLFMEGEHQKSLPNSLFHFDLIVSISF